MEEDGETGCEEEGKGKSGGIIVKEGGEGSLFMKEVCFILVG